MATVEILKSSKRGQLKAISWAQFQSPKLHGTYLLIGHAMAGHMRTELVADALSMATRTRTRAHVAVRQDTGCSSERPIRL
jgi:uncharacterized membrane protein YraQ (UPF0718 family)